MPHADTEDSLPGLEACQIVPTPYFDTARHRLNLTLNLSGCMAVSGVHGSGKRVAVMAAVAERRRPHRVVRVKAGMTATDLVIAIHHSVHADSEIYDKRMMENDLLDTFSTTEGILVIDKAHNLSSLLAAQLAYLHPSSVRPAWTFVLLGGPGTARAATVDADLRGEVVQAMQVRPLKDAALWQVVRGMHPFFTHADSKVLEELDAKYCRGLPKNWYLLLGIALNLREQAIANGRLAPTLNASFATSVLRELPQMEKDRKR